MQFGRDDLVAAADIARELELSQERIRQLAAKKSFPKPIGKLGRSRIWRWRDVERWAKRTGRL